MQDAETNIGSDNAYREPMRHIELNVKNVLFIREHIKEWKQLLLFKTGVIKKVKVTVDGKEYTISNMVEYKQFWDGLVKYELKKGTLVHKMAINGMRNDYHLLKVKDGIVVDIGANIGDSVLYFAEAGAKKIYAFEPYPYLYDIAKANVKLCDFDNIVELFNEGVGSHTRMIKVDPEFKADGGSSLNDFGKGKEIKVISLEEITKKFNLTDALLKLDTEGAEYEILLESSDETLRKFKGIVLEYHRGYLNISNKLKNAGFRVRYTGALKGNDGTGVMSNDKLRVGILYAERRAIQ